MKDTWKAFVCMYTEVYCIPMFFLYSPESESQHDRIWSSVAMPFCELVWTCNRLSTRRSETSCTPWFVQWFLEKSWKPRRFYVASLEIWAAWDPSRCLRLSRDFIQDLDSGLASLWCWIDVYFVICSVDIDIILLSLLLSVSLLLPYIISDILYLFGNCLGTCQCLWDTGECRYEWCFVEIENASGLIQVLELEVVVILIVVCHLVIWATELDLEVQCQLRCLCCILLACDSSRRKKTHNLWRSIYQLKVSS